MAYSSAPRPTPNPDSADAAVLCGAQFLDTGRRVSPHWRDYIDLATLNIGSFKTDVLAQIGTDYETLDLDLDQAITYGFEPAEDDPAFHAALTAAWRRYLSASRKQVA